MRVMRRVCWLLLGVSTACGGASQSGSDAQGGDAGSSGTGQGQGAPDASAADAGSDASAPDAMTPVTPCVADDACEPEWECGTVTDECGERRTCGRCAMGESCREHVCVARCDGCVIDGACLLAGEALPSAPCRICDPDRSTSALSDANDGAACDDASACTVDDQCTAGVCSGAPKSCDDGVTCNGVEGCDASSGACVAGSSTCGTLICNVASDTCEPSCADGCLIAGVCYPWGTAAPGNECLECDPSTDERDWTPRTDFPCGESTECSAGMCNAQGQCVLTARYEGYPCGDGITECGTWRCNAGACTPSFEPHGTSCGTKGPCDAQDTCNGAGYCLDRGVLSLGTPCVAHGFCGGEAAAPSCECEVGYEWDDGACVDVDECALGLHTCDRAPAACVNDDGDHHCACPAGFVGDGDGPRGCECARVDFSPSCKPWSHVAITELHACAISDGALYCWGKNDKGQLGLGDKVDRLVATRVGTADDWSVVSVGNSHSCGLRSGALYCWGDGGLGALGHAGTGLVPERVGTASDWTVIATGRSATCGIRDQGELYCWGWNGDGQIGLNSFETAYYTPQRVVPVTGFTHVSMDSTTACAIRAGELFCWGGNTFGQLGDGTTTTRRSPVRVGDAADWQWVDTGGATCGGRAGGALYCWGVGRGKAPELETELDGFVSISLGLGYQCGLRETGEALCWGSNGYGRLGDGTVARRAAPTPVVPAIGWQQIQTGWETTCGIRDGGLSCWGGNENGVRGTGGAVPTRAGAASDWTRISTGLTHSCGLRGAGELYCWGVLPAVENDTGSPDPVRIGTDADWQVISAGTQFTCGIRAGELYCWGLANKGRLGDGSNTNSAAPVRIGSEDDWVHVSAGWDHACGVRENGDLYCWGANAKSQLGDGGTTDQPTPKLISSLGWSQAFAGYDSTCALRSGQLYCWGSHDSGKVGNGLTSGTRTTPLRIGTSDAWTRVSVGWSHTCGIDAGALFCWGSGIFGQLGLGGTSNATTPTRVGTESWSDVEVDTFYSCGTRTDGRLFCWGNNGDGQLGTGDFTSRLAPASASTLVGFSAVATDSAQSCALRNGALYCWGRNEHASLGHSDGLLPTPVLDTNDVQ